MTALRPLLPYRYWRGIRNCGDAITAYLLRDILKVEPVVVGPETTHLLATGSILFMHSPKSIFWGCGVMDTSMQFPTYPSKRFFAVRGKLTLQWLHEKGITLDVPIGDPGMLAAQLPVAGGSFGDFANQPAHWRAAVVPHWTHFHHPKFQRYAGSDEVTLVDMRDATLRPLETIAKAEVVVSESLHGLIFAESLGKPSLWIGRPDPKWTWKFHDWYSNSSNAPTGPVSIDKFNDGLFNLAEKREILSSPAALLNAFPHSSLQLEKPRPLLPFDQCRHRAPELFVSDRLPGALEDMPVTEWQMRARRTFDDWSEPVYWGVTRRHHDSAGALTGLLAQILDFDRALKLCCLAPKSMLAERPELQSKTLLFKGLPLVRGIAWAGDAVVFRDLTITQIKPETKDTAISTLFV